MIEEWEIKEYFFLKFLLGLLITTDQYAKALFLELWNAYH